MCIITTTLRQYMSRYLYWIIIIQWLQIIFQLSPFCFFLVMVSQFRPYGKYCEIVTTIDRRLLFPLDLKLKDWRITIY